ncbi:TPA: hypothetical protein PB369_002534 [Staphylococcus aureus]|nr:hypothetical protein [Staphylococcus aureus]
MENKTHYFEAHGKDYKLEVAKDMFGCEGVTVIENGLYMGMMDCKDERDYKQIENMIRMDKHFVYSDEVYC